MGPGMRDPIDMVAQLRVVRLVDVVDFDVPQKFLQHISGELVLRFAVSVDGRIGVYPGWCPCPVWSNQHRSASTFLRIHRHETIFFSPSGMPGPDDQGVGSNTRVAHRSHHRANRGQAPTRRSPSPKELRIHRIEDRRAPIPGQTDLHSPKRLAARAPERWRVHGVAWHNMRAVPLARRTTIAPDWRHR